MLGRPLPQLALKARQEPLSSTAAQGWDNVMSSTEIYTGLAWISALFNNVWIYKDNTCSLRYNLEVPSIAMARTGPGRKKQYSHGYLHGTEEWKATLMKWCTYNYQTELTSNAWGKVSFLVSFSHSYDLIFQFNQLICLYFSHFLTVKFYWRNLHCSISGQASLVMAQYSHCKSLELLEKLSRKISKILWQKW